MFNNPLLATVSELLSQRVPPVQLKVAPFATVSEPLIVPPFQSRMAKLASAGIVMPPELTTTWLLAVGTCCGFQLAGLFQSLETAPVQVRLVVTTKIALELTTEPKALLTITA